MRAQVLELQNFMSYESAVLDLTGVSLASVVGRNGAGKSTLAHALLFALTGARSVRTLDRFVRRGTDECRVILSFGVNGSRYRVTRSVSLRGKNATSTLELARDEGGEWVPEGSGVTDTERRLRDLLGRDEQTILLTNFIGQSDAGAFFDLKPAQRLDAVGRIIRIDETYGPLEQYFKARADKARTSLETGRRELERLESEVATLVGREAELVTARADLDRAKAALETAEQEAREAHSRAEEAKALVPDTDEARARLRELEQRREGLIDRQGALGDERGRLIARTADKTALLDKQSTRTDVEAALAHLAEAEKADAETRQKRAVLDTLYRKHDEALQRINGQGVPKKAELERLNKQAAGLTERITAIETAEAPLCDRCGQPIADAALARTLDQLVRERTDVDVQATKLAAEIEELRALAVTESGSKKAVQADISALPPLTYDLAEDRRLKNLLEELNGIPAKLATIAAAEERLLALAGELETVEKELADPALYEAITEARAVLAGAEEKRQAWEIAALGVGEAERHVFAARESVTEAEKAVARHEEAIAMLAKSREKATEIRGAVRADEQALADAELLKDHFSKWGVPALIVGNFLAQLEAHVNRILADYEAGFSVRFAGEKETKDGDRRTSLEILVDDGQTESPYEDMSGGEQYRVASSLRLGLAEVLSHRSGCQLETIVLDEPEGLDASGRVHLIKIVERLGATVPLVILMSHHDDLQDALPAQILVTREGRGPSHVEVHS